MAIYWFTGIAGTGKTTLATKLHNFLKTEKRNWRKDVFLIDSTDVCTTTDAQFLANYLYQNDCDVVISMISPELELREKYKSKFPKGDFQEIHLHRDGIDDPEYQNPVENYFSIDTTRDTPNISFSKLLHFLETNRKL